MQLSFKSAKMARSLPKMRSPTSIPMIVSELQAQTWQFPARRMAKILSPKTPLNGRPVLMPGCRDSLKNYACIVDNLESALDKVHSSMAPVKWSPHNDEILHYQPLAILLNQFVQASHAGLDADPNFAIKKADRWYADLSFVIVEPPLHDEPQDSESVPALAGIVNFKDGDTLDWTPHDGNKLLQIPVAGGRGWTEIVLQAYMYAKHLFDDSPLRQFALVLGYDCDQDLRFLVFHRGGMTASHALSVETDTKEILRLFMSIAAWSSPSDAGLPEWCNSTHFRLPRNSDDTEGVFATLGDILYNKSGLLTSAARIARISVTETPPRPLRPVSLPLKLVHQPLLHSSALPSHGSDRMDLVLKSSWTNDNVTLEDRVLHSCSAQFGNPKHYFSFLACHENQPITNHLFLPEESESRREFHFRLSYDPRTPHPTYRSLNIHVTSYAGKSLLAAKTPWDIFVSLGHAMLGWLSITQKGYLHRDISIGNICMLDEPIKTQRFNVRRYDSESLVLDDRAIDAQVESVLKQMSMDRSTDLASEVEGLLKDLGISDMCKGFVVDVGVAIDWRKSAVSPLGDHIVGTPMSMSSSLLSSPLLRRYFQSPVDDLFSFYYVGQWTVVHNEKSDKLNHPKKSRADHNKKHGSNKPEFDISSLRNQLDDAFSPREAATRIITQLTKSDMSSPTFPPFLKRSARMLRVWQLSLDQLKRAWDIMETQANGLSPQQAGDLLVPQFHRFALAGVVLYLRLLVMFRDELQKPM